MSEDCRNDGLEVGASLVLKFSVPPPHLSLGLKAPFISNWKAPKSRLQGQVILGGGRIIKVAEILGL